MLRTTIFIIYQKNNHLPQDVLYLLKELKTISDKIVIVVNGNINEKDILEKESDYLIIRENLGFDAGAYKTALNDKNVQEIINQSDELVFCNDTFYGPLVPFRNIFKKMDSSECDFWGLSLIDRGIEVFLQSNFLVFRKTILKENILIKFFKENIDEKTTIFKDVLRFFEHYLFTFLIKNNYSYGYYCKITTTKAATSILFDHVPILRKKLFIQEWCFKDSVLDALCYIKKNYKYPINFIIEDVKKRFSIDISDDDFLNRDLTRLIKDEVVQTIISREQIQKFIAQNISVYLYGMGKYAQEIIDIIGLDNIAGFIVSNDQVTDQYYYEKKVICFCEIKDSHSLPIIVAMGLNNSKQVKDNLKDFTNVLYLWDLK